jgi:hypothetical protein
MKSPLTTSLLQTIEKQSFCSQKKRPANCHLQVLVFSYADYVFNIVQEKWTIFILYRHYTLNYWTILQMLLVLNPLLWSGVGLLFYQFETSLNESGQFFPF